MLVEEILTIRFSVRLDRGFNKPRRFLIEESCKRDTLNALLYERVPVPKLEILEKCPTYPAFHVIDWAIRYIKTGWVSWINFRWQCQQSANYMRTLFDELTNLLFAENFNLRDFLICGKDPSFGALYYGH